MIEKSGERVIMACGNTDVMPANRRIAKRFSQDIQMLTLPAYSRYAYSPIVKRSDYSWPEGRKAFEPVDHGDQDVEF